MVARRAPAGIRSTGAVALIFGADQPLGAAAAVALAAAGTSVLLVGTHERALAEAVGEIAFGGGRARHLVVAAGGAATPSALAAAMERAASAFGEGAERRFVFAPGWDPPGDAAAPVFVLRAAESAQTARLAADAARTRLDGAGRAVGHVFVAPGGEHPRALAAVLGGPLGVFVLPKLDRPATLTCGPACLHIVQNILKLSSLPMEAAAAAAHQLRDLALVERVGERASSRLLEVRELFAEDLAHVDAALTRAVEDGVAPATHAAAHLLGAGGKRVRPLCLLLSAGCFGVGSDSAARGVARDLAVVAELVHLATLLHDDVIDDSDLRRGSVTARRVWGNAVSVLAGDLLLTHALERTAAAAPGPTMTDLIATLRRLVDGEVVQLRGRAELTPSESVYFTIIEGKTASLFGWSARAGARLAGAPPASVAALGEFGHHMGIAFQLVDDALDYDGATFRIGKRLLSDLHEGKATLPLLLAMAARPELVRTLQAAREGSEAAAGELLAAVMSVGGAERTRVRAAEHTAKALAALAPLPASRAKDLLSALAAELSSRGA